VAKGILILSWIFILRNSLTWEIDVNWHAARAFALAALYGQDAVSQQESKSRQLEESTSRQLEASIAELDKKLLGS